MKYLPLVWAALRRRPVRTLLTMFSIVTAFFLFGALQGINVGINQATELTSQSHLVVMSRVQMQAPMPLAHLARIRAIKGVTDASPVNFMIGTWRDPKHPVVVVGADLKELFRISSDLKVDPKQVEAATRTRTGVIVGETYLKQMGWKVGDRIPVHALNMVKTDGSSDWVFDIVGSYTLVQPEWATRVFANFDYLNEGRAQGKDQSIEFYVGIDDPKRSAAISQAIDDSFANSPDQTQTANEKDFLESTLRQIGDINFLVNGIVGAVIFTLMFLTANTMSQSVRERIPELAVLKTLGFTDGAVQWLVLAEALALSLVSAFLGVGLAALILPRITSSPALAASGIGSMHVPHVVFAAAIGVAVLLALVSGIPPATRARRLNIITALSGR